MIVSLGMLRLQGLEVPFAAMLVTQRCGLRDVRSGLHCKGVPRKLA